MKLPHLLASLGLVLLAACSHDDKPAQTSPDVAADPATPATATAMPTTDAAAGASTASPGHSACDAVRCGGGLVCKMVDGKPTCVARD